MLCHGIQVEYNGKKVFTSENAPFMRMKIEKETGLLIRSYDDFLPLEGFIYVIKCCSG